MTTTMTETVEKMAKGLVALCRQGKFEEAISTYYGKDIVSIESMAMGGGPREIRGIDAVIKKGQEWEKNTEVHSLEVSEPLVAGSYFTVRYVLDATYKNINQRMKMEEIAVYKVENGKIVREEFLYDTSEGG